MMTLSSKDAQFIDTLYGMSIEKLMQVSKTDLRKTKARIELLRCWLNGIDDLIVTLEEEE